MSRFNVAGALAIIGAIIAIAGIIEAVDLVMRAWSSPAWSFGRFGLTLLTGPLLHFGLGLMMWRLGDRGN